MLTDADCKNASCPSDKKRVRLSDAGNLYLEVTPNGAKRWFWKYWLNSKERRLALGSYPAISLKAARIARDAAKAEKAAGVDPVLARQQEKMRQTLTADSSFKAVALQWHKKQKPHWSDSQRPREGFEQVLTSAQRRNRVPGVFPRLVAGFRAAG